MGKQRIYVGLGIIEEYMDLEELDQIVQEAKARALAEGIESVSVDIVTERGYYNDVDVTVKLEGWRLETDEEFEMRQQEEQRNGEADRKKRLALYKQLRTEFGE